MHAIRLLQRKSYDILLTAFFSPRTFAVPGARRCISPSLSAGTYRFLDILWLMIDEMRRFTLLYSLSRRAIYFRDISPTLALAAGRNAAASLEVITARRVATRMISLLLRRALHSPLSAGPFSRSRHASSARRFFKRWRCTVISVTPLSSDIYRRRMASSDIEHYLLTSRDDTLAATHYSFISVHYRRAFCEAMARNSIFH